MDTDSLEVLRAIDAAARFLLKHARISLRRGARKTRPLAFFCDALFEGGITAIKLTPLQMGRAFARVRRLRIDGLQGLTNVLAGPTLRLGGISRAERELLAAPKPSAKKGQGNGEAR